MRRSPIALAAELARVAEDFLARHQIRDEPATWQPPTKILDGLDLPGPDLAGLDLSEIHKLARAGGASAAVIARDPAGGARRRARYTISREQFRDLHHGQGLSFTEIGQRTRYSRTAIKDLARAYEIPASIDRDGKPFKAPAVPGHTMSNSRASL